MSSHRTNDKIESKAGRSEAAAAPTPAKERRVALNDKVHDQQEDRERHCVLLEAVVLLEKLHGVVGIRLERVLLVQTPEHTRNALLDQLTALLPRLPALLHPRPRQSCRVPRRL